MTIRKIKDIIKGLFWIFFSNNGFHVDEKKIAEKYYFRSQDSNMKKGKTEVVFMIDGRAVHGGLTDRIRGICTIYQYCKENNLPFFIHHTFPFELDKILEPNKYNWRINTEDINYDLNYSLPVLINDYQFQPDLHKLYLSRLLKKNKNKQIHIYSNAFFYDKYFSDNFKSLFKPAEILKQQLDINLKKIKPGYIGVVLRFQQLLGDFEEKGYPVLPQMGQKELIEKCINEIIILKEKSHINDTFLITSDSVTFLNEVSKLSFVFTIPGQVVHIDHTVDVDLSVYMKSYIDFLILSNAKQIYLLKVGEMYKSTFAQRAAMVENKPYHLLEF